MYEYIEGPLIEKNPAYCVIDIAGIGYFIQISLTTYSQLESHARAKLYIHQVVREDAHLLFGFYTTAGTGNIPVAAFCFRYRSQYSPNDAFILTPDDLQQAILSRQCICCCRASKESEQKLPSV